MAAPASSTVSAAGVVDASDCGVVALSEDAMSRPQPESRTAKDRVSSPCFVKLLPQVDIVSHQFIDEFGRILQRHFSVICGLVQGFSGENRQEVGAYRAIHGETERYMLSGRFWFLSSLLFIHFMQSTRQPGHLLGRGGTISDYKFKRWAGVGYTSKY